MNPLTWLRERLVYVLFAVVLLQSGVIAWLLFSPDVSDAEWRTVNQQMEQSLKENEEPSSERSESGAQDTGKLGNEVRSEPAASEQARSDERLDLNAATAEQLEQLPRIGPSKAQAILELRTRLGGFTSVDQLLEVKGIGEKTLEAFKDQVTISSK